MDIVVGGLEVGVWVAIIGGAIGAIFILRAVVCWYLRLSLIASLLVQIRDRLPEVIEENQKPSGIYPRKDEDGT